MNISILSNLFNKSGGPTGTGGCSENEELRDGKCQPRLNYSRTTHMFTGNPARIDDGIQSTSYFPGASQHKGALYAHKARHNIK